MSLMTLSGRGGTQRLVGSIYFPGSVDNDDGRVKILADTSSKTANIGSTDITVEMWLRPDATGNNEAAITAGANNNWIWGNIFFDRDRNTQPRSWGMSLGDGRVAVGVMNGSSSARTIVGSTDIRDAAWHHIAFTRNVTDGTMSLYVDGTREATATGPTGTISYPDGGDPIEGYDFSDPYLVLGAEKHDLAEDYKGFLSEVRLSTSILYSGASLTIPTAPLTGGVGLYHFNESGSTVTDYSGNSNGTIQTGAIRSGMSPF